LKEVILSADFCGSVAELPDTLRAFEATILSDADTAALHSLLQRLPDGLDYLRLCKLGMDKAERMVLELPALPKLTVLRLEGIALRTGLPPSLQELVLDRCTVSDELQLPVTLRKLRVLKCDSSSNYVDGDLAVHFNEGLQQAIIVERQRSVDIGGELPSTLTHLVLRDASTSPLGPLPSGLLHLDLNRDLAEPLSMLPGTLEVLQLGNRYEQPLDVLPDTLTELKVGRKFNQPLGLLPPSLKFLQIGNKFEQDLGPLPLQLEHLDISKSNNKLYRLYQLVIQTLWSNLWSSLALHAWFQSYCSTTEHSHSVAAHT
jgi:FNIP Repeat